MKSKNQEYIRPKEVDLLALLEAGELDYIFLTDRWQNSTD